VFGFRPAALPSTSVPRFYVRAACMPKLCTVAKGYANLIEQATALVESNNHLFFDGNKPFSFVMTDVMLRADGYYRDVEPFAAHKLITEALKENEFRFPMIRDWLASITKPTVDEED
jgi:prophage maintenance system killer protein